MNLIMNGKATNGYYRIDDLEEQEDGLDFLMHPWAMVRDQEAAQKICQLLNEPVNAVAKERTI